jgi:hypothetical protein
VVAVVELGLAAAGLALGEIDDAVEVFKDADGGHADVGGEEIGETGDEEGDMERGGHHGIVNGTRSVSEGMRAACVRLAGADSRVAQAMKRLS